MPQFDVDKPLATAPVEDEGVKSQLYTHPNIREKTHEQLLFRLDIIRNRRLVAAIEYKADSDRKRAQISAKLLSQYAALNDRNRLKLNKIFEMIEDVDRSIGKQIELSHKMSIVEEDLI